MIRSDARLEIVRRVASVVTSCHREAVDCCGGREHGADEAARVTVEEAELNSKGISRANKALDSIWKASIAVFAAADKHPFRTHEDKPRKGRPSQKN